MSKPENIIYAARLIDFLKLVKLTRSELSRELKTPRVYITNYTSGTVKVPSKVVNHLHTHYRLNMEWFYKGEGKMRTTAPTKNDLVTDVKALRTEITSLEIRLDKMEKLYTKLHTEFYELKHAKAYT